MKERRKAKKQVMYVRIVAVAEKGCTEGEDEEEARGPYPCPLLVVATTASSLGYIDACAWSRALARIRLRCPRPLRLSRR